MADEALRCVPGMQSTNHRALRPDQAGEGLRGAIREFHGGSPDSEKYDASFSSTPDSLKGPASTALPSAFRVRYGGGVVREGIELELQRLHAPVRVGPCCDATMAPPERRRRLGESIRNSRCPCGPESAA